MLQEPNRHRYDGEVLQLEERLIFLGWGTLAIHNELAKSFPRRKVPAVNTIGKHITGLKHAGLLTRGRIITTKRPGGNAAVQRALRQNGFHHQDPETIDVAVEATPPAEDKMLRIIRLAMRHGEDHPKVQASLGRIQGALDILTQELKTLGDLLSGE